MFRSTCVKPWVESTISNTDSPPERDDTDGEDGTYYNLNQEPKKNETYNAMILEKGMERRRYEICIK